MDLDVAAVAVTDDLWDTMSIVLAAATEEEEEGDDDCCCFCCFRCFMRG